MGAAPLRIGVLALQGDVREHVRALEASDVEAFGVRRPRELDGLDGLVLPGGESTTIAKLARHFEVLEPLRACIREGLPTFGTCAGMILLADRIVDGTADQETIGGLDVTVRRNAFGRQVDSFEADLEMIGVDGSVHAVFIRAPWVEQVGDGVKILAAVGEHPVAIRQGHLMATSFHPEIDGDGRVHGAFVDLVRGR
ncbi:pyridoxal 5'-phosphate synthase glutaminase subunit PdxT [Nocardioides baekrokdamisoli]|uniref:pyridoxal 5'-phosphate synthase glutaminase subunit PdxT n=1 Tax=Nocardioides baekrokdamisoli TaxID=1804624 RepID=UPI000F791894|nr:pyridoxal 5'-phosphate synthase glutaminase subunit PdxT [Nocardioides baekrokdamisoli]